MLKLNNYFSKITRKGLVIGGLILFSSFGIYKYVFERNDVIFELMLGSLNQNHYSPQKLDDAFSEKVFNLYLKRLDYSKKFLLQSDFDELQKYKKEIDDQIITQNHTFYKRSVEIINQRIKEKENCKI